jgi:hypothetical protein
MLFDKSAVPKNMDECLIMSVASFSNIRFRNISLCRSKDRVGIELCQII